MNASARPRHARTAPPSPSVRRRLGTAAIAGAVALGGVLSSGLGLPASAHTSADPTQGTQHQVVAGEALSTIAADYAVSVDDLATANGLDDPDLIRVGQTLVVPGSAAAETPLVDTAPSSYVVAEGDSLWSIAAQLGVELAALVSDNELGESTLIVPGQTLVVPGLGSAPPAMAPGHVVETGDSLWGIAASYGLDVSALADVNELGASSVIVPGQYLVFPAPVPATIEDLPADLVADPLKLALMPLFDRWAAEYDVPPELVKAVAWFESGWNNVVVSSAGALGIGQVLPITGDWVASDMIGEELDLSIPEDNIRIATRYLRYLLDQTGDVRLAVASYYQGLSATRQHGIYDSSVFYVDGILSLRERFD